MKPSVWRPNVSPPKRQPVSKLNDWKQTFGKLFEDWISGCTFWGYTDLDLIYGNLVEAVPKRLREDYDIISPKGHMLMGPFTLFRNTRAVNELFRKDDEWQEVLKKNPDNFRLDYALSREQKNKDGGKMYIQDKVAEYADEIFTRMDNVRRCRATMRSNT